MSAPGGVRRSAPFLFSERQPGGRSKRTPPKRVSVPPEMCFTLEEDPPEADDEEEDDDDALSDDLPQPAASTRARNASWTRMAGILRWPKGKGKGIRKGHKLPR